MWQGILSILQHVLQLLSGWQEKSERNEIKQDGKNEEKLENITIINDRKRRAADIINGVLNDKEADSDK